LEYLGTRDRVRFVRCNLRDLEDVQRCVRDSSPDEIYNFAAQSSVGRSFQWPQDTLGFNIISVMNLLEALRTTDRSIRFYQSSSSEMFGKVDQLPIREDSPMHPLSPYAVSKATAHWMTINYRESYGLFACCGICFNHESYLRDNGFFVKKVITEGLRIKYKEQDQLRLGNLEVRRDFGLSPRYVEAMWLMLQHSRPDDFIICSGRSVLLWDIVKHVFDRLEIGMEKATVDRSLVRPNEILDIYGDNSKAKTELGWDYDLSFFDVLDLLIDEELGARKG